MHHCPQQVAYWVNGEALDMRVWGLTATYALLKAFLKSVVRTTTKVNWKT